MNIRRCFKAISPRKEHAHETSARSTTIIELGVLEANLEWTVKALSIPNAQASTMCDNAHRIEQHYEIVQKP